MKHMNVEDVKLPYTIKFIGLDYNPSELTEQSYKIKVKIYGYDEDTNKKHTYKMLLQGKISDTERMLYGRQFSLIRDNIKRNIKKNNKCIENFNVLID